MVPIKIEITVTKILVIVGNGSDKVSIFTSLPDSIPKSNGGENLCLDFVAPTGYGAEFVRNTFHIEPEVLTLSRDRVPFSDKNRKDLDVQ